MKYTFIAENYPEEEYFRTVQEADSFYLSEVVDNFSTFLRGAGFSFDGKLEFVDSSIEEPSGLWTWSTTEPVNTVFDDVDTFMTAAGQFVPEAVSPESDQSKLYKKLIDEEYAEFVEADEANDDVERIDACFDMIWVIIGYMKSRGWDCSSIWAEGAQSNLSKIDPETGVCIRRPEDGKILKPEGWKPPDFSQFA